MGMGRQVVTDIKRYQSINQFINILAVRGPNSS